MFHEDILKISYRKYIKTYFLLNIIKSITNKINKKYVLRIM